MVGRTPPWPAAQCRFPSTVAQISQPSARRLAKVVNEPVERTATGQRGMDLNLTGNIGGPSDEQAVNRKRGACGDDRGACNGGGHAFEGTSAGAGVFVDRLLLG